MLPEDEDLPPKPQKVENLQQWEELERREDEVNKKIELLKKLEANITQAVAERDSDEKELAQVILRKNESEARIRKLTTERLAKAQELSTEKAQETLLQHFAVLGAHGSVGSLSVLSSAKLSRTNLFLGAVLLAIRVESTPMVPVFLVARSADTSESDKVRLALIKQLKAYMKGFVELDPDILEDILAS